MNYGVQNWAWLSPIGVILIIVGMVMTFGSAWISYRFFDQNGKVNFALKVVGVVLCLLGFMLTLEMYRF